MPILWHLAGGLQENLDPAWPSFLSQAVECQTGVTQRLSDPPEKRKSDELVLSGLAMRSSFDVAESLCEGSRESLLWAFAAPDAARLSEPLPPNLVPPPAPDSALRLVMLPVPSSVLHSAPKDAVPLLRHQARLFDHPACLMLLAKTQNNQISNPSRVVRGRIAKTRTLGPWMDAVALNRIYVREEES